MRFWCVVLLQLLGGDSFGDPTELLPYLGPGGSSGGTTAAADPLMTDSKTVGHGDDIMALFS